MQRKSKAAASAGKRIFTNITQTVNTVDKGDGGKGSDNKSSDDPSRSTLEIAPKKLFNPVLPISGFSARDSTENEGDAAD